MTYRHLRQPAFWALFFCVILAAVSTTTVFSTPVRAGYSVSMTPVENPFAIGADLSGTTFADDWVAYVLGVASDDGSLIGAVDIELSGTFHQRSIWDIDTQSFQTTPTAPIAFGADSHLLPLTGALIPVPPKENNDMFTSPAPLPGVPGSVQYGIGSAMKGVWGVPGASATSLNLAYLVMPRGAESQLEYAIDVANPLGQMFNFRQGASFPFPQPPVIDPIPSVTNPQPVLPPVVDPQPLVTSPPVVSPPIVSPVTPPVVSPPVVTPPAQPFIPQLSAWATQVPWSAENGLPTGFAAYQLNLSAVDSSLIAAVDLRLNAPLHQQWADVDSDGILDPSPRGLATTGSDSHLLIPENGLVMPLSEDNQVAPSPLDDGSGTNGVGSHLSGAWAVPGSVQSNTADLAYIVVPESLDFHDLDLSLGVVSRIGDSFSPIVNIAANNFSVLNADGSSLLRAPQPIVYPTIVPPVVDPPSDPLPDPTGPIEPPIVDVPPVNNDPIIIIADPPIDDPLDTDGPIDILPIDNPVYSHSRIEDWHRNGAGNVWVHPDIDIGYWNPIDTTLVVGSDEDHFFDPIWINVVHGMVVLPGGAIYGFAGGAPGEDTIQVLSSDLTNVLVAAPTLTSSDLRGLRTDRYFSESYLARFSGTSAGTVTGGFLDAAVQSQVPEPATILGIAMGALVLNAAMRRRPRR